MKCQKEHNSNRGHKVQIIIHQALEKEDLQVVVHRLQIEFGNITKTIMKRMSLVFLTFIVIIHLTLLIQIK